MAQLAVQNLQFTLQEAQQLFDLLKQPGETIEQFYTTTLQNPDPVIDVLRLRNKNEYDARRDLLEQFYGVNNAMGTALGKITNNQALIATTAPYLVPYMNDFITTMNQRIENTGRTIDEVGRIPTIYNNDYVNKLEDYKRRQRAAAGRVEQVPKIVEVPSLYRPGPNEGKMLRIGDFFGYLGHEGGLPYPMSVEAYHQALLDEYPGYLTALGDERDLVVTAFGFKQLIDPIFDNLHEFDIIDTAGYRGTGYLYIFSDNGQLYLTPTVGEYGYYLPKEAFKMIRQFNINNLNDLEEVYGQGRDLLGLELPIPAPEERLRFGEDYLLVTLTTRDDPDSVEIVFDDQRLRIISEEYEKWPQGLQHQFARPGGYKTVPAAAAVTRPASPAVPRAPSPPRVATPAAPPRVATPAAPPRVATPAATPTVNYNTMKVPELKDLLRTKGLKVGGTKAELIQRLQTAPAVVATQTPRAPSPPRETIEPIAPTIDYNKMTVKELKQLITDRGQKPVGNKPDLIKQVQKL